MRKRSGGSKEGKRRSLRATRESGVALRARDLQRACPQLAIVEMPEFSEAAYNLLSPATRIDIHRRALRGVGHVHLDLRRIRLRSFMVDRYQVWVLDRWDLAEIWLMDIEVTDGDSPKPPTKRQLSFLRKMLLEVANTSASALVKKLIDWIFGFQLSLPEDQVFQTRHRAFDRFAKQRVRTVQSHDRSHKSAMTVRDRSEIGHFYEGRSSDSLVVAENIGEFHCLLGNRVSDTLYADYRPCIAKHKWCREDVLEKSDGL